MVAGYVYSLAVRRSAFLDIAWLGEDDYRKNIYDFILKATEDEKRAGHIEKVLFHAYRKGESRAAIEKDLCLPRILSVRAGSMTASKRQRWRGAV